MFMPSEARMLPLDLLTDSNQSPGLILGFRKQYSGHFFRGVAGKLPTVIECKCHKHKAPMDSLQSILAEALAAVGCFTNPNVSFS